MFNNNGIRPQGSRASNSSTPPPRTTSTPPHTPPHVPQPEPAVSAALEGLAAGGSPPRSPRRGEGPAAAQGRVDAHSSCGDIVAAWVNAAAPGEQRREAAVRVALSVSNGTTALNLFDLGLRTLPPRLHSLGHLRSMVASGNHLAGPFDRHALPSHLEHLAMMRTELTLAPDLQDLTELSVLMLDQNRLTVAPVVGMLPLRILSLSNNQISVPPDLHLLTGLQALTLDNNLLVAVPDVRGLNDLMILNLSGNRLTTVPPWIVDLPGTLNIQLDDNPLSAETIAFLQNLQTGPRILHSMVVARDEGPPASLAREVASRNNEGGPVVELNEFMWSNFPGLAIEQGLPRPDAVRGADAQRWEFLPNTVTTTLRQQVDNWLETYSTMPTDQRQALQRRWEGFAQEPSADQFTQLLAAIRRTDDYRRGGASRETVGRRVVDMLETLAQDDQLRLQSFSEAHEGLESCGDRVALTFSNIAVAVGPGAFAGKPDELLKLARGEHRLREVERIAMEHLAAHPRFEEVSVVATYRMRLTESLELPAQAQHVPGEICGGVEPAQLEAARRRVLDREQANPEDLFTYIAQRPSWQATLRQQPACADEIAQATARRDERSEALQEENDADNSTLTSGQYRDRYEQIERDHQADLQRIYVYHTAAALGRMNAGRPVFDEAARAQELPPEPAAFAEETRPERTASPDPEPAAAAGETRPERAESPERPSSSRSAPPPQGSTPPPQPEAPPPAHVNAVAKLRETAARIQDLSRQGRVDEATALAHTLLEPEFVAALHSQPVSRMGAREAAAMDNANILYMDLLGTLADRGLIDAKQAFDQLSGTDATASETPYFLHIASRVGAGGPRDAPAAAPHLVRSNIRLLDKLANARAADGEENVRSGMRTALLDQTHTQRTAVLRKERYAKYTDYVTRLLMSGSPSTPSRASLAAVHQLREAGLLPDAKELRNAGMTAARVTKFKNIVKMADDAFGKPGAAPSSKDAKAAEPPANPHAEPAAPTLAEAVQALDQFDIATARATDKELHAQWMQQKEERERAEHASYQVYSTVSSAVNNEWERVARLTYRSLARPVLAGMVEPVGTAGYARAAESLPLTAPSRLVDGVRAALMATPLGQALTSSLAETRKPYKASEHAEFDQMLHDIVGSNVGTSLADLEARLRGGVRAAIAASNARDRAWAEGDSARRAAQDDEATRRVQANARGPERVSNGVPSAVSSIPSRSRLTRAQEQEMRKLLNLTPSQPLPDRIRLRGGPTVERRRVEDRQWSDSIRDLEQRLARLRGEPVPGSGAATPARGQADSRRTSVGGQSVASEDLQRRYEELRGIRSDSIASEQLEQRYAALRTERSDSIASNTSMTTAEIEQRLADLRGPDAVRYAATTEEIEGALSRLRETDITGERITTEYIENRLDRLRRVDDDLVAQLTQQLIDLRGGAESLFVPPPRFDATEVLLDPIARQLANMQGTGEGVASLLPPVPAQRSGERRRQT